MDSFPESPADNNEEISFSRKEIFLLLKNRLNENVNTAYDIIEKEVSNKLQHFYILPKNVKSVISKLISEFRKKWQQVRRTDKIFFEKFNKWLSVSVPFIDKKEDTKTTKNKGSGRRSLNFEELSERTKRMRTHSLREEYSAETLAFAAQMSFRASGNLDVAKVVKDVTTGNPSTASRYRRSLDNVPEKQISSDAALALLVENKLSKSQYQGIRSVSIENNCKLYPPYKSVLEAKQKCYPPKSEITVTESSAQIKLQSLLNHTAERILLTQTDVIKSLTSDKVRQLDLICKWGCDGTSGQSTFKQKFTNDDGTKSDSNIFFTSLVPLQLLSIDKKTNSKVIVWKNPRPSSPRFCRPIKIEFLHETAEATRSEIDCIKEQEKNLVPFQTIVDGKEINIYYKLALTMVDGKVCNSMTNTASSQRCYICQATSKQFNDIDKVLNNKINEDNLQFGISSLHAWIRFFECCLHLSYKLEIKKWQARCDSEKESVNAHKRNIQKNFRLQLGLIVDQPKQGFGSTNDGNTARRFFEKSTISASITGVDLDLIKRFHVILQVISCGHDIDLTKFQEFTLNTARKFVELYPWFNMPTTVHKILIHSSQIIASLLLPIGQMSEEAQESCNKYIKQFRQNFARKCSRIKNMEDVLLRLLVTSDPLISSVRKLPQKKMRSLSSEAVKLLIPPTIEEASFESSIDEPSDDDNDSSLDSE